MRFTSARSFPFFVGMLVSLLPLALQHQALAVTGDSRDAQAAFERKDYDTAVRLLNSLLAAQPDNAAGYELRALAHGDWGRPEEALADHDHLAQAREATSGLLRRICVGLLPPLLAPDQGLVRGGAATGF